MILSISDLLDAAPAIEFQQRIAARRGRRNAPLVDRPQQHAAAVVSLSVACSSQRCERLDRQSGDGEQGPQASTAFFHSEATVRRKRQSLADAADFVLQLEIGGRRRARLEHVRFDAVARAVDVHHVVVGGAEQVPSRRRLRRRRPRSSDSSVVRGFAAGAEQVQGRHLPKVFGVGFQQLEELADQRLPLVRAERRRRIAVARRQTSLSQRCARA